MKSLTFGFQSFFEEVSNLAALARSRRTHNALLFDTAWCCEGLIDETSPDSLEEEDYLFQKRNRGKAR